MLKLIQYQILILNGKKYHIERVKYQYRIVLFKIEMNTKVNI